MTQIPDLASLTDEQLRELAQALLDFEPGAAAAGERCLAQGRVGPVSWDEKTGTLRAWVTENDDRLETEWRWDGRFWQTACRCPLGGSCRHAFALGRKVLERPRRPLPGRREAGAGGADRGRRRAAEPELEAVLEHEQGRGLKPAEKQLVRSVERLFASFQLRGVIDWDELARLARGMNPGAFLGAAPQAGDTSEIFGPDVVIPSILEFWQHLAVLFRERAWRIPPLFAAITDTAGVEARLARRREAAALREWREKLLALEGAPSRAAAAPRDRLRLALTAKGLVFQVAGPDGSFATANPHELAALARGRSLVRQAERWDLPSLLLAGIFEEARPQAWFGRLQLRDEQIARGLWRALLQADLADRLVDETGAPLERPAGKLAWQFIADETQPDRCLVALGFADGAPAPQPLLHLGGPPHLYLSGNRVIEGPAPLHARADAGWRASFPAAVFEDERVVRSLIRAGALLPETVTRRIERVALGAVLRGRVGRGGQGTECVQFAFLAADASGELRAAFGPNGWTVRFAGAPEPSRDDRVRCYEFEPLEGAARHFSSLRLAWNAEESQWERGLQPQLPGELYAWLAAFPGNCTIELSPELAGLHEPPVRATLALNLEEQGRDWFDVSLVVRGEDARFTPEELQLLLKAQGSWVRLEDKGWRRLALAAQGDLEARLETLGLAADATLPGKQRFHALQLAAAELDAFAAGEAWRAVRARAAAIRAIPPPALPEGFRGTLRPYQLEGFHFLAHLATHSLGGVLADDMGLGKTVQALAWLGWLAGRQAEGAPFRVLVVCPKSVMTNWEREAARFVPGLRVKVFRPQEDAALPDSGMVVANYAQLRNRDDTFLGSAWTAAILDEGQNIKNPGSQTAGVARRLKAEHRLVLTGTPVENRVLDLWSLLAFAMPGLLGGRTQFERLYDDRKDPTAPARLARRVRHFVLRRTKAQVARELPPRIEEDVLCELEGEQRKLYQAELKRARQLVLGVEDARGLDGQRFNVLQSLLRLRQICCHPALLGEAFAAAGSAKVAALFEQIEPILEEGHKVLVFSQFVSVLTILRREFEQRGIQHLVITGQTENRQELVDRFQTDPAVSVFLLSLKAAGSGLNLTAASYVVLFDPWWNPAVEAQAIDRTHRIGQTSQVIAYRLVALDTVEEKIRRLQAGKEALAREVVREETLAQVLDLDDLRYILG